MSGMLTTSNYSLRSKSGSEPNYPDHLIGSFATREIALDTLNRDIANEGKASGNDQLTIVAFTFDESPDLIKFCSIPYHLVEALDGREVLHLLFPKNVKFDPLRPSST